MSKKLEIFLGIKEKILDLLEKKFLRIQNLWMSEVSMLQLCHIFFLFFKKSFSIFKCVSPKKKKIFMHDEQKGLRVKIIFI